MPHFSLTPPRSQRKSYNAMDNAGHPGRSQTAAVTDVRTYRPTTCCSGFVDKKTGGELARPLDHHGQRFRLEDHAPRAQVLDEFGISYEKRVVRAPHPDDLLCMRLERGTWAVANHCRGGGPPTCRHGRVQDDSACGRSSGIATPLRGLDALLRSCKCCEVGVATVVLGPLAPKHAAHSRSVAASRDALLRAKLRALHEKGKKGGSGDLPWQCRDPADEGRLPGIATMPSNTRQAGVAHQSWQSALRYTPRPGTHWQTGSRGAAGSSWVRGEKQLRTCGRESHDSTRTGRPDRRRSVRCVDVSPAILDLPPGFATFGHRPPRPINAALFAATIISKQDSDVWKKLRQMRKNGGTCASMKI